MNGRVDQVNQFEEPTSNTTEKRGINPSNEMKTNEGIQCLKITVSDKRTTDVTEDMEMKQPMKQLNYWCTKQVQATRPEP